MITSRDRPSGRVSRAAALLLTLTASSADAATFAPDDPNIRYTGRVDARIPSAPVFGWPGGQIAVTFEGALARVTLTNRGDGDGSTFWAAIVDGGPPEVLELPAGSTTTHAIPVAAGAPLDAGASSHTLVLHRRSEWYDGTDSLVGLEVDALLAPPSRPSRRIEFYGDSITVGLGLDWTGSNDNTVNEHTNNYMAYGAMAARSLGLEYHCQAVSGIGLVGGWGQMSSLWDLADPSDGTSLWDFSSWIPDVIVQNLGQNDQWQDTPTEEEAIQGYIDYVQLYRDAYGPDVPIVLAIGSMAASRPGSPFPGYIQAAIDELRITGDFKVSKCIFPYDGLGKHPDAAAHVAMADRLAEHLGPILSCGDGVCGAGEDSCRCEEDCGPPAASETNCSDGKDDDCDGSVDCFDGACDGDASCPGYCSNGICDPLEDCNSCPEDCPIKTRGPPNAHHCCGDGVCEGHETLYPDLCPVDCDGTYCGDGACDTYEDVNNCVQDCGGPSTAAPTNSPTKSLTKSPTPPTNPPVGTDEPTSSPTHSCGARFFDLGPGVCPSGGSTTLCCSGSCWANGGKADQCQ